MVNFLDIIHYHKFYLKTPFRRLDSFYVLSQKPTPLGTIDRTRPYLRTGGKDLFNSKL
jgi:hypothetical protein